MQSIGERLEEARKRKGISIREAAEATKIRSDYLHKFESNQYDIKLPEIYIRGFLRTYANYLKVPADKVINDYNGLGLGDNKGQRSINREVYGRMDLSVGSKTDKDTKEPAATAVDEPAASAEASFKNPATFIPRPASGGLKIAPDILIKGGILVGIIVIVVLLSVWLFSGRGSKPSGTTSATSASEQIWVKPLAGEPVLVLIADGPVAVTVATKSENTILYQGTIPRGDVRAVPRRGALKVTADPHQNLLFEIGGKRYPMPNQRTAEIYAP